MPSADLKPNFQAMAELRYQIRRFLRFSETAARQAGLEPQQHQLLLAVKGLPEGIGPTISALAERLQLQHHSVVGLIDRLVDRGLLVRLRAADDRRKVLVKLSQDGENCLRHVAFDHLHELQLIGPRFIHVLQGLLDNAYISTKSPNSGRHSTASKNQTRRDKKHG